ncbi:hypothetical protein BHE74_00057514 [Ensete ventricosum]|nr:hypothetical protein BHE74_00057514 [Ensete ventricosum]
MYDIDRLQRKIAAGSFLLQRIVVGCDQGAWQPEVAISSIFCRVLAMIWCGFRAVIAIDEGYGKGFGSRIDGNRGLIGIIGGMLRKGAGCRRL